MSANVFEGSMKVLTTRSTCESVCGSGVGSGVSVGALAVSGIAIDSAS
jgi:hypothetical protein